MKQIKTVVDHDSHETYILVEDVVILLMELAVKETTASKRIMELAQVIKKLSK